MRYTVLVIGVGALGKRHLSSILNSALGLDVFCFDINKSALDGFQWEDTYNNKSLKMISSFEELNEVDFALFAMTSGGRRETFDKLVETVNVRNILFEKVLFQTVDDYTHVQKELERLGINAWVNCARRQMDSYQNLKKELSDAKEIFIEICGSEWGMACNSIHEIDIIEFLTGSETTTVEKLDLIPKVFESKRTGYKEVYGTISGKSGKCKRYVITCLHESDVPDVMTILTDVGQFIVIESQKKLIKMTPKNDYQLEIVDFEMPYQSQMTQFVMEDILLRGDSRLTKFDVSARLHLEFIKPLITFFETKGLEEGRCPIT